VTSRKGGIKYASMYPSARTPGTVAFGKSYICALLGRLPHRNISRHYADSMLDFHSSLNFICTVHGRYPGCRVELSELLFCRTGVTPHRILSRYRRIHRVRAPSPYIAHLQLPESVDKHHTINARARAAFACISLGQAQDPSRDHNPGVSTSLSTTHLPHNPLNKTGTPSSSWPSPPPHAANTRAKDRRTLVERDNVYYHSLFLISSYGINKRKVAPHQLDNTPWPQSG
jgi:hypothetical protein